MFPMLMFYFLRLLTKISQLFVSDIFTKIESSGDYIHPLIYRVMTSSMSKLVEMFICQIFLMDYSIWVAKF